MIQVAPYTKLFAMITDFSQVELKWGQIEARTAAACFPHFSRPPGTRNVEPYYLPSIVAPGGQKLSFLS